MEQFLYDQYRHRTTLKNDIKILAIKVLFFSYTGAIGPASNRWSQFTYRYGEKAGKTSKYQFSYS